MAETKYKLRYLPLFYEDLEQKVVYIAENLQNPKAANDLIDAVEKAIVKRVEFVFADKAYGKCVDTSDKRWMVDDIQEVFAGILNYLRDCRWQKHLNHMNSSRRGDIHIIVSMLRTLLFGM